jgi:hypothetical protein
MLQTVFAPGASPFHTKGLAYRGHLEFVAEHVPGGVAAQNAAFGDEALRAFFKQPFVAGGWYDVFPLAEAGLVCARLRGEPLHALLQTRARHQVQRDLRGVYGFLARFASQRRARGELTSTCSTCEASGILWTSFQPSMSRAEPRSMASVDRTGRGDGLAPSSIGTSDRPCRYPRTGMPSSSASVG